MNDTALLDSGQPGTSKVRADRETGPLVPVAAVVVLAGVSAEQVEKWIASGRLKCVVKRRARCVFIDRVDELAALEAVPT